MDIEEKEKLYGLIPEKGDITRSDLRKETGWDVDKLSHLLDILYQEGMVSFRGAKQKFVSRVAPEKIYEEHLDRNIDIPYLMYNIDMSKLDALSDNKEVTTTTETPREKGKHLSELERRLAKVEGRPEPQGGDQETKDDLERRFIEVYKKYRGQGRMPTYDEMKDDLNIPLEKVDELINLLTSKIKRE